MTVRKARTGLCLGRRPFVTGGLAALAMGLRPRGVGAQDKKAAEEAEAPPAVAAAWDLKFALPEIVEAFMEETGEAVEVSFGLCQALAQEIRKGAPYQIYLSADENNALGLANDGLTPDKGVVYGAGRIALMVAKDSRLKPDGSLKDLGAAIGDGRLIRLAIANPALAVFGRSAEQALRKVGLWEPIQPKLVLGETSAQAAEMSVSENVSGGVIAYPLALANKRSGLGQIGLIPRELHRPLPQRMIRLNDAGPIAQEFYAYLQQPAARAILRKFGFYLDEETR